MGGRFSSPAIMRVCLVGLDAAGKTTILYKLKLGDIKQNWPTIGFCVETIEYKNVSIVVWDLQGQSKLKALWRHYLTETGGVIFVINSHSLASQLHQVRAVFFEFLDDIKSNNPPGANGRVEQPLLVFANHQDLSGAMKAEQISQLLDLPAEMDKRGFSWHLQPCCAMSGDGLAEGFEWLSQSLATPKSHTSSILARIKSFVPSWTTPTMDEGRVPSDEALRDNTVFLRAFENHTLPPHQWTHKNHLRMAWLYLRMFEVEIATRKIVNGIQTYNAATNPKAVYRHTMTLFWTTIIRNAMQEDARGNIPTAKDFEDFAKNHAALTTSRYFEQFYTKDVLFGEEARTKWVVPDLKELPMPAVVVEMRADPATADQLPPRTVRDPITTATVSVPLVTYRDDCAPSIPAGQV